DDPFACLPAWMTDEAASRFQIGSELRFPLDVLRSLRNEVDALLGFLASESKTERPENDVPIRESPAKPVRDRATVRRTACSSKERARDGHRGAAARDRGGAGKGGKRGKRRAPREGELLLAGLLRCGHCGRKLHVHYGGKIGRYNCYGARTN